MRSITFMQTHPDLPTAFESPALACDSHFHVFGPAERYPYAAGLRYKPPVAELSDYRSLAELLGMKRFVFVQPSAYGRDNSCMFDAMRQMDSSVRRAIVDIDEYSSDADMASMHDLGVRGVRINISPVHPYEEGLLEYMLPRIQRLDACCTELGWHLDFLLPGWLTQKMLPTLAQLEVDHSLAHMGMFLGAQGPQQAGFVELLDLLKNGPGKTWIKFTGTYRMATAPAFSDALPMAQAILGAAPDRVIWGSDYPHLSFADKVGSVALFNLLKEWAPDAATRQKILQDNPSQLFGF
jgi:predicted TIM-barrel fold metal-dependent hydrolase